MTNRKMRAFLALVGASLPLLGLQAEAVSPTVRETPKLSVKNVRGIGYAWVDVPRSFRLNIRVPRPFNIQDAAANVRCAGVAMTGGYMMRDRMAPEGLVVIDGRQVNPHNQRKDGGILDIRGSQVTLYRRNAPQRAVESASQIYSQPILILDGKIDGSFKNDRANRIAMGKYADGQMFMVMAFDTSRGGLSAVSLNQFAVDTIGLSNRKIDWLLNFDGGPSAFLQVAGERLVSLTNGKSVSYLCAEPRND